MDEMETFPFHSWDSSSSFTRLLPSTNNSGNSMKNALENFPFVSRSIIKPEPIFFISFCCSLSVFSPWEIKKIVLTIVKNAIWKFQIFFCCKFSVPKALSENLRSQSDYFLIYLMTATVSAPRKVLNLTRVATSDVFWHRNTPHETRIADMTTCVSCLSTGNSLTRDTSRRFFSSRVASFLNEFFIHLSFHMRHFFWLEWNWIGNIRVVRSAQISCRDEEKINNKF